MTPTQTASLGTGRTAHVDYASATWSGTPTTLDATGTTIQAWANNTTHVWTTAYLVTVVPALEYPSSSLTLATTYQVSTQVPTVNCGWCAFEVHPALPAGLSLDASTGAISGTPTEAAAQATYTVHANASNGTDSATLTIEVLQSPVVSGPTSAQLLVGQASSLAFSDSSGHAVTWSASPALPSGLSLDASTGVLSGTPASAGSTSHTITATSSVGSGTLSLSLEAVAAAPVALVQGFEASIEPFNASQLAGATSVDHHSCAGRPQTSFVDIDNNRKHYHLVVPYLRDSAMMASVGLLGGQQLRPIRGWNHCHDRLIRPHRRPPNGPGRTAVAPCGRIRLTPARSLTMAPCPAGGTTKTAGSGTGQTDPDTQCHPDGNPWIGKDRYRHHGGRSAHLRHSRRRVRRLLGLKQYGQIGDGKSAINQARSHANRLVGSWKDCCINQAQGGITHAPYSTMVRVMLGLQWARANRRRDHLRTSPTPDSWCWPNERHLNNRPGSITLAPSSTTVPSCWGGNGDGQLGDGILTEEPDLRLPPPSGQGRIAVAIDSTRLPHMRSWTTTTQRSLLGLQGRMDKSGTGSMEPTCADAYVKPHHWAPIGHIVRNRLVQLCGNPRRLIDVLLG